MPQLPVFVTGNQDKADYLSNTLDIRLKHHKLNLEEIQSVSPEVVLGHKLTQAYNTLGCPVIVEDTSLVFNALNDLPGPFVKFFVDSVNGLENMCRLLDGFEDRSAYASAIYGFYDGVEPRYFSGRLNGVIAQHPRGSGGYGWDPIFEPEGYDGKTRAELSPEDDLKSYKQIRDTDSLRDFLRSVMNA